MQETDDSEQLIGWALTGALCCYIKLYFLIAASWVLQ
jgi:hypothetical protein